jgi:2-methylcitrate dehydratase
MDTLGCAFGGYGSAAARIARDLAATVTSSRPATLLCSGQKTSAELAAFANDVMIRYLDYNDGYISRGSGHPSDSIAALLAAGEVARAGGRELILATVLAYEVFCRICDAWDNKEFGVDHVTIGAIASAAGAARLLGLTGRQIVETINLTVAANIAINQTRVGDVAQWKACGYGNANRNALFAAELASRGMTGPSQVFEGRDGFFRVVSRRPFELAAFGGNGRPYGIMRCHLKRFPLGNFSQTVVTAILEGRKLAPDWGEIAEVHIRTSQKALNIMADEPGKWRPRNRETADHSIPYTAGVALMYGTVDQGYFNERYLHDAELLGLVSRIKCSASEEANRRDAEINPCDLELVLRSGERKSVQVEHHRGHWRNPMSDAEVEEKFRSLAAGMLPPARLDALAAQLWKFDELAEVGTLVGMTKI